MRKSFPAIRFLLAIFFLSMANVASAQSPAELRRALEEEGFPKFRDFAKQLLNVEELAQLARVEFRAQDGSSNSCLGDLTAIAYKSSSGQVRPYIEICTRRTWYALKWMEANVTYSFFVSTGNQPVLGQTGAPIQVHYSSWNEYFKTRVVERYDAEVRVISSAPACSFAQWIFVREHKLDTKVCAVPFTTSLTHDYEIWWASVLRRPGSSGQALIANLKIPGIAMGEERAFSDWLGLTHWGYTQAMLLHELGHLVSPDARRFKPGAIDGEIAADRWVIEKVKGSRDVPAKYRSAVLNGLALNIVEINLFKSISDRRTIVQEVGREVRKIAEQQGVLPEPQFFDVLEDAVNRLD